MMFPKYGRYIPVVFFITFLFTLGNLFFLYNNLETVHLNTNWVNHSHEVKLALQDTLQALTDAETNERGYLLSGDKKFLEPFNIAIPHIQKDVQSLDSLTKDNPEQKSLIPQLKSTILQRLNYLNQGIKQQQRFDPTRTFEQVSKGRLVMTNVRQIITKMENQEDFLLKLREDQTTESYQILYISSIIGGLLNLSLLLLAFYLMWTELRRRNQLERNKDEFISMASHELKTPITSLKLFVQILHKKLQEKNNGDEAKELIKKITNQTEKLTSLVTDLLDITRIQTGKLKIEKSLIDVNELLAETVEAVQETTRKHTLTIKGRINQTVNVDRYRIYQVLVNLLTNAIKYSPNGGPLTITIKNQKKHVIINITDKGIGIEKKHLKKIFTKLYQVAEPTLKTYPGLGIGLFVSSEIVKQHNGKIWVESIKGKGSTFSFSLPLKT